MTFPTSPSTEIFPTRSAMGAASARHFLAQVRQVLTVKPLCRVIFGCAPSQNEFFHHLVAETKSTPELWPQIEVFHMDDYVGLNEEHPQSFRHYLRLHLLDHVKVGNFHPIRGEAASATAEAARYAALLGAAPIDVIGMGLGENCHIAFNDPPVADFADPVLAKVVTMDEVCRQQQVNDGCFPDLPSVPSRAITITIPVFAQAGSLVCTVPGPRKAQAVRDALTAPVGPACPGTILQVHPHAALFLDRDSAARLEPRTNTAR
ncbi:MAG: 6-phosphogluconolactonase [Candidatus Didemnitutus sp.]|nr:6-phosphogluconolactonase [Candidatus Didemnitutus sp.]